MKIPYFWLIMKTATSYIIFCVISVLPGAAAEMVDGHIFKMSVYRQTGT